MKTSPEIAAISEALAKAQGKMRNATLNKVNPHFKSRYADLSQVRDTVIPALSENGIAVVQGTETDGSGILVTTRLVHSSGQWFESAFPISFDKPQSMGSAYTYARRYSLSAICGIAADEDDDANAANEKSVERTGFAGGTNGASKASSRADYDTFVNAIRSAPTVKALADWHKNNSAEIDKLPPDWVDELRTEFVDRKSELNKALSS